MTRKPSIFKSGKSATMAQQKTTGAIANVDTSKEALERRAAERKRLPDHPLTFTRDCFSNRMKKEVRFDFTSLAEEHPDHRPLISHLLVGISLTLQGVTGKESVSRVYRPLMAFIPFLDDEKNLLPEKIYSVADIDGDVFRAFKMYIASNPSIFTRKSGGRYYSAMSRAVTALKKTYPDHPLIGQSKPLPKAPWAKGDVIQGYNKHQTRLLIRCCIKDIKAIKKFHAAFEALGSESPQFTFRNLGKATFLKHDPNALFMQILATLKRRWPEYPFYMGEARAKAFLNTKHNSDSKLDEDFELRRCMEEALLACSTKISFMKGTLERGAILAAQHFVPDTIFPFLLLAQIASGFNVECLKFIPDRLDEVIFDSLINLDNLAVIYGFKHKTKKLIPVKSKKRQAFGTYQLLNYIKSVIKRYEDSEHYVKGALFQYGKTKFGIREECDPNLKGDPNLFCSFHGRNQAYPNMAKSFVRRHGLEALIGKTIDSRKVRSLYGTFALNEGKTPREIGQDYGHADADTTGDTADKHYLSDKASIRQKNKAVAKIQGQMLSALLDYKSRIVESITLQKLRDGILSAKTQLEREKRIEEAAQTLKLEEKVIVHLLDAGVQTYILACTNMTNPSWPGHDSAVKNGQCRQFNKCCLCARSVVFPEALPYIAKRIMDLEEMQYRVAPMEWTTNYDDENDGWRGILDAWPNRSQIESAWDAARSGKILLPKVMKGGSR
jgi:hypothetical protein